MRQKGYSAFIFICIVVMLALSITGGSFLVKNYLTPQTQEKNLQDSESSASATNLGNGIEIKYIGSINEFNNGCWSDSNCSVKVDDKWIVTIQGGLRPTGALQEPAGKLIGLDHYKDTQSYLGKKVEVYAKIIKDNLLTIYGNQKYYIKVLDN